MPAKAKKRKDLFAEMLRDLQFEEEQRRAQYYRELWQQYAKLVQEKIISLKLATGAWFLVRNGYANVAELWASRRNPEYHYAPDGQLIPNKMIVYRELSRLGYKWNETEKLWLAK